MNKIRYQVLPLILTIALSVCSTSVSAARHQDTKTPDFIFSSDEDADFALDIIDMNTGDGEQLETQITYTDKILKITGLEPFSLEELQNGAAGLEINYSFAQLSPEENQKDSCIRSENKEGSTNIGEVVLTLSEDEPYWRICNENGSWGIGIRDIGVPEVIYELLPDKVYGLEGINYSCIQTRKGTMNNSNYKSKIVLIQNTPIEEEKTILLTDLQLPKNIIKQITANKVNKSNLEIMTNYTFKIKIPLDGTSTNCKKNSLWIEGKITIRYTVEVKQQKEKYYINEILLLNLFRRIMRGFFCF